jgi:hypothetical protein
VLGTVQGSSLRSARANARPAGLDGACAQIRFWQLRDGRPRAWRLSKLDGARSAQLHQGGDRIIDECLEARPVRSKQPLDIICGAVANAQPHDLRRGALQDTEAVKVLVLCDQDASEIDRALPHCFVRRTAQADVANVHRIRTQILKLPEQGFRQLLVEEHPHS